MTAIDTKYTQLGGNNSFLGAPIIEERVCPDGVGHYRHYQYGSIYWHPNTGAHEIHGSIRQRWSQLGWETSFLGYPLCDETVTPDGVGRFNHFQGGAIYWHPNIGAFEIHGAIKDRWAELGWERGFLGYPTTDETPTPDGRGRFNHFQGGSIYWHPDTGAFEVHGEIRRRWAELGWERSFLGYPITNETATPDGVGRYNHFQNGSIYWHPNTGAHEVHGAIRYLWSVNNWEQRIGYPTTDETPMNPADNGRYNNFEHGSICWAPKLESWYDFTGAGEGRFAGTATVFLHTNFAGTSQPFSLSNGSPIVFMSDLERAQLHDQVSSIRIRGFKETCSVYFYENSDFSGKYLKVTGRTNGAQVDVSSVGSQMNDKISSILAVQHGRASALITPAKLVEMASSEIGQISMDGLEWTNAPEIKMVPGERSIRIRLKGVIEETWPDSDVQIDIYFRPYVAGDKKVKVGFNRWYAEVGGSFAGYANSTILRKIREYFDANATNLENMINHAFDNQLSNLNQVPELFRNDINIRRVNILPEGLEIVLADSEVGANILRLGNVSGISFDRPQGAVVNGQV